jgi:hypothetical protein
MIETDSSESEQLTTATGGSASAIAPIEADEALLVLESQFNNLAAELVAAQRLRGELVICPDQRLPRGVRRGVDVGTDYEAGTREVEAILARLDPIERAIMATPARTIAGLGVKARHAAYVTSQYWNEPIDKIDWEARAVRLLIEAVCNVAHAPLLSNDANGPNSGRA